MNKDIQMFNRVPQRFLGITTGHTHEYSEHYLNWENEVASVKNRVTDLVKRITELPKRKQTKKLTQKGIQAMQMFALLEIERYSIEEATNKEIAYGFESATEKISLPDYHEVFDTFLDEIESEIKNKQ